MFLEPYIREDCVYGVQSPQNSDSKAVHVNVYAMQADWYVFSMRCNSQTLFPMLHMLVCTSAVELGSSLYVTAPYASYKSYCLDLLVAFSIRVAIMRLFIL